MRVDRRTAGRPVPAAVMRYAAVVAGLAALAVISALALPGIRPAPTSAGSAVSPPGAAWSGAAAAQKAPGPARSAAPAPVADLPSSASFAASGPSGGAVAAGGAGPGSASSGAPPGSPAGPAPQVPAGARFVHAPRRVPASAGATQICPTPTRPGQMSCMALIPRRAAKTAAGGAPPPASYAPADLRTAYGLTSAAVAAGGASTVAVVDAFSDPSAASDLAVYRAQYGLRSCPASGADPCLRIVNAAGGTKRPPPGSGGWAFEESVDLDMISAICPNCRILLVEAKSDSIPDLAMAEEYASKHASVVSDSWGSGAEFTGENVFDSRFEHPGVAIVAAAGDSGYGTQYPAAAQFVTAVGGTTLVGATASRRGTQTAWSGTGSGCSSLEAKPAWQSGVAAGCKNRTGADVAAVADPHTPVAIYDSDPAAVAGLSPGWNQAGGTSVATPIIAATYALAGALVPGTYAASYPYRSRADFTDVTSGRNGTCEASRSYLCHAGPGYDGPTGLGTPDGTGGFAGPGAAVTVTDPGTQDLAQGGRTQLRMSAIATGTGRLAFTAKGLPAGLSLDRSDGLISGQPAAAGTFTVTVGAASPGAGSGSVTFTIVVIHRITNHHPVSGQVKLDAGPRCLTVSGRGQAGARAEIRRCAGRGVQVWRYVAGPAPGGPGSLKLRGRCLTAAGTGPRARAALHRCRGAASQRWLYRPLGQLYHPASGKCLADPGNSKKNRTRVVLTRCRSAAAQSWLLPAGPVLSGVAGQCLTDPGGSSASGTRLVLSPCRAGAAQRWTLGRDGTLRTAGRCLAVAGGSMLDGAAVRLASCSGAASQKWSAGPYGELLSGASGRCLAAPGSSASGARLVQEDCYGTRGEIWAFS
jgi:Ricin-type beta-trefoil lectin domain/Putative Ig domain